MSAAAVSAALLACSAALLAAEDAGKLELPRNMLVALLGGAALLVFAASNLLGKKSAGALPVGAQPAELSGDEKKDFMVVFNALTAELLADVDQYNLPPRTRDYMKRCIEYNVPKGKLTRGLTVISALKTLKTGGAPLSPADYRRAATLGWCVEWLQAMFLVMDDIMDESETRRGQICWYLQPDVKMNAINDGLLLEAHIYVILKRYFDGEPELYVHLLELLHETTHQTALGQFLDLTTSEPDKVDFSRFSMQVYTDIVVYKTAWYSFYLPCALGMRLAGVSDPTLYQQAKDICREMGTMFQVQDDYLDCYGDPERIGKIGTDIRDNKCSWLINRALMDCSSAQRRALEANYAKKDPACEKKVKDVFKALDIEKKFKAYEEETHASLLEKISNVKGMPTVIFSQLLARIHKRDK
jgi:farnesyl diphosphate synthase